MNNNTPIDTQANQFDKSGRFILNNFDHKKPFSSFLPGIAGLLGIPMWVFYVNRGQAVCSFGIKDKDHPILEFQSANKAYQNAERSGFRTFLNGFRDGQRWEREVFSPWQANETHRTMYIGLNEVEIQEVNNILGYQVNVLYFMLPNLSFSGLVRRVTITNLFGSPLQLEIMDGLPGIVPYGVSDGALKNVGRTIEAWMQVNNLENNLAFYKLKATPGDTAAVSEIEAGNYAMAFNEGKLLPSVADPAALFGLDTSFSRAHAFHNEGLEEVLKKKQIQEGRSPCAFFGDKQTISPANSHTITSVYGFTRSLETIQSNVNVLGANGYLDQKLSEARNLAKDLTNPIATGSSSMVFDAYCRQTFLDNFLRGGYPLVLGGRSIAHVYSRKHGDIERDYNYFVISPEYYSQGNGNYRDINQNRRTDVFFVPQAGAFNIRLFMSLIQADGYNPLVINGLRFMLPDERLPEVIEQLGNYKKLIEVLKRDFTPGEVVASILDEKMSLTIEPILTQVFSKAEPIIQAEHGEGFWIDHWTYNLDLIESYLAIFPDHKDNLLFNDEPLPFYDNAHVVQPRKRRFVLLDGKPSQLNAVIEDEEKSALINGRDDYHHWARTEHGSGEIFALPLISKLLLLAILKFATRDPSGYGIQMEAGRPGWYDALNGLPGLFGSSMVETYELLRLVNLLSTALEESPHQVSLPIESLGLINTIRDRELFNNEPFIVWVRLTDVMEEYRAATWLGFDGQVFQIDASELLDFMQQILVEGITKAETFAGEIPPTYFVHQVLDYSLLGTNDLQGNPHIEVHAFKPVALPAFLEGIVRRMKISTIQEVQQLYSKIKESDLYDSKLEMYKVNTSLLDQPHEIGRARAFTPGWLENESVWMHMAFKYLLELQQAGLNEIFFTELRKHLPAFKDVKIYGRSPLENSSFIVSSVHPDQSLHGEGFVARLSGSTAEFLSMWVNMTAGKIPFRLDKGNLLLTLEPCLPGWLFDDEGEFEFRFLGLCQVKLHNPDRVDTYSEEMNIKKIVLHTPEGIIDIIGKVINFPYSERVRNGEIESIEIFY